MPGQFRGIDSQQPDAFLPAAQGVAIHARQGPGDADIGLDARDHNKKASTRTLP